MKLCCERFRDIKAVLASVIGEAPATLQDRLQQLKTFLEEEESIHTQAAAEAADRDD